MFSAFGTVVEIGFSLIVLGTVLLVYGIGSKRVPMGSWIAITGLPIASFGIGLMAIAIAHLGL